MGFLRITDRVDSAVSVLAKKLTKAIFYRETGNIFPSSGEILFHWFTNRTVLEKGSIPALDQLEVLEAAIPKIFRNGKDLSDQFDYRFSLCPDNNLTVLRVVFGRSFGFVTIASLLPLLSDWLVTFKKEAQSDTNPFKLI